MSHHPSRVSKLRRKSPSPKQVLYMKNKYVLTSKKHKAKMTPASQRNSVMSEIIDKKKDSDITS